MDTQLSVSDVKNDLENLLACIKCHMETGDTTVIQETLRTVIAVCTNYAHAKDSFRELGGLNLLINLLTNTTDSFVSENVMKTLAHLVDENVYNQKLLTTREIFVHIQSILAARETTSVVLKNAIFFSSTLLFQNIAAQVLARETGCIESYISLYRQLFPSFILEESFKWKNSEAELSSIETWQAVNIALCFTVNNPINEENQRICSALFPMALKILQCSIHHKVICAVSSFLSFTISNNVQNQDILAKYNGLNALKSSLQKGLDSIMAEKFNIVIFEENVAASVSIISVIDVAITEHEQNSAVIGKIGAISSMIKLLSSGLENEEYKVKIILTLSHCIDACAGNKRYILEEENFPDLLKANMATTYKDLQKACLYLLQVFLTDDIINQNVDGSPWSLLNHSFKKSGEASGSASCITENKSFESDSDGTVFSLRTLVDNATNNEQVIDSVPQHCNVQKVKLYLKEHIPEASSHGKELIGELKSDVKVKNANKLCESYIESGDVTVLSNQNVRNISAVTSRNKAKCPYQSCCLHINCKSGYSTCANSFTCVEKNIPERASSKTSLPIQNPSRKNVGTSPKTSYCGCSHRRKTETPDKISKEDCRKREHPSSGPSRNINIDNLEGMQKNENIGENRIGKNGTMLLSNFATSSNAMCKSFHTKYSSLSPILNNSGNEIENTASNDFPSCRGYCTLLGAHKEENLVESVVAPIFIKPIGIPPKSKNVGIQIPKPYAITPPCAMSSKRVAGQSIFNSKIYKINTDPRRNLSFDSHLNVANEQCSVSGGQQQYHSGKRKVREWNKRNYSCIPMSSSSDCSKVKSFKRTSDQFNEICDDSLFSEGDFKIIKSIKPNRSSLGPKHHSYRQKIKGRLKISQDVNESTVPRRNVTNSGECSSVSTIDVLNYASDGTSPRSALFDTLHSQARRKERLAFSENRDDANYVQVFTFPGSKCVKHSLVKSFEMLQVIPVRNSGHL